MNLQCGPAIKTGIVSGSAAMTAGTESSKPTYHWVLEKKVETDISWVNKMLLLKTLLIRFEK